MELCPSESLAELSISPVCALFSPEEWTQYEYFCDLQAFYTMTGYGNPLGPVQGVGYINELLARLTNQPVSDNTQTNRTLDSSPETFPLNRTFYIDFTHGNNLIAVFAAMGLFKEAEGKALDPRRPDPKRRWVTNRMAMFSARMVVERLECDTQKDRRPGVYVRVLVNDALEPLEFCGADKDGLCDLESFVESQSYARENGRGDFERCLS